MSPEGTIVPGEVIFTYTYSFIPNIFLDNNISIEPHEIISLNMESLDRLVNLMLARLETINADHGTQLDLLARSYLDKQLNIFPTTEIVKRIGFS